MLFYSSQFILIIIIDFLTKIYKITIDCFKPTISVGSTLTHVRYYLDDPVHLLVSGTSCEKCDSQFVHQVFGAIAGDCSSLNNWRFILLLRWGRFCLLGQSLLLSFQKSFKRFLFFFINMWFVFESFIIVLVKILESLFSIYY